jgi:hypothetical protein
LSEIDIEQLLKILPTLIRENDQVKGAIITALSGVVATKEDIKELSQQMDKRFEAMQAEMDKRFEAMDKRFEAMQAEMDKRFEAMDKRFEAMDKRFEAMDKRFDGLENEMRSGFSKITGMLESLTATFGKPFEQFGRNVITRLLEAEGFGSVLIKNVTYPNPDRFEFSHSEVEIDGISEDPAIIVEITSILKDWEKVEKLLKKKRFVEHILKKPFRGFLVAATTEFDQKEKLDLIVKLKENQIELINL